MSSTAIKATDSKNLRVINCKFQGFDTDIELNNVDGFVSEGNVFSKDDPRFLLNELGKEIQKSNLSCRNKMELSREILTFLAEDTSKVAKKRALLEKIAKYVGNKGVDLLVQLVAGIGTGYFILRFGNRF